MTTAAPVKTQYEAVIGLEPTDRYQGLLYCSTEFGTPQTQIFAPFVWACQGLPVESEGAGVRCQSWSSSQL